LKNITAGARSNGNFCVQILFCHAIKSTKYVFTYLITTFPRLTLGSTQGGGEYSYNLLIELAVCNSNEDQRSQAMRERLRDFSCEVASLLSQETVGDQHYKGSSYELLEDGTLVDGIGLEATGSFKNRCSAHDGLNALVRPKKNLGELVTAEDTIASSESRTGLLRAERVRRRQVSNYDYFEFHLAGEAFSPDTFRTRIRYFQIFSSDGCISNLFAKTHLLYSMPTGHLNHLLQLPFKATGFGLKDLTILVPLRYIAGSPAFLYYRFSYSRILSSLDSSARGRTRTIEEDKLNSHASVGDQKKKSRKLTFVRNELRSSSLNSLKPSGQDGFIDPTTIDRKSSMSKFLEVTKRFLNDESGVTAIEYGLIASLIVVGIGTAVTGVSTAISNAFESIAAQITGSTPTPD
jgi:pilus assembly protein Flp/PilA